VEGMRASDISGVGGPAATPAPGPSLQQLWLPLLLAPPPGIGSGAGVGWSGERGRRCVCGGMMASDIGGVGGPAATLAPARRRSCAGSRCCWRSSRVSAAAAASAGAGSGEEVGGRDEGVGYQWRWRASSDAGSWPVAAAAPGQE
jgi:hypothetical protein